MAFERVVGMVERLGGIKGLLVTVQGSSSQIWSPEPYALSS